MLLTVLAFAALGCGEGEAKRQIRATLAARERAWTKLDFPGTCKHLTEAAQRASEWCAEDTSGATLGNEPIVTSHFETPKVTDIDVDGDRATVRHEDGEPTRMLRVDGRWLIDAG